MTKLALFGAGGKMGVRRSSNPMKSDFDVRHVEVPAHGRDRQRRQLGVTCFVTHPCHPPIFNEETEPAAKHDYFGGVAAWQSIVNALMQGPESHYDPGDRIGRTISTPVTGSHRVSVEQLAMPGPGLSEAVRASLLVVTREAMDAVAARGAPADAARDFLLGHMNILAAVIFDQVEGAFSDACNKAIEYGKPMLMREDWKQDFEPHTIADGIERNA